MDILPNYGLINDIEVPEGKNFYIIHLMGQHYQYEERYPQQFDIFKDTEYQKNGRVKSRYDNATIYNDYCLSKIFNLFADKDAVIIYLSDHGEEVCDISDFYGHGNANTKGKEMRYQIEIPMFIWASKQTIERYNELFERIRSAEEVPFSGDRIADTILDIAGISTSSFTPSNSIINDEYIALPRSVLQSVNFDEEVKSK